MDILDRINEHLNEGKKTEMIVQWDAAQKELNKFKKGNAWGKKHKRINKTLASLGAEAEGVMAKRDYKKMRNWLKKLDKRTAELKYEEDKVAYRHLYVTLDEFIREMSKEDWQAEGWE